MEKAGRDGSLTDSPVTAHRVSSAVSTFTRHGFVPHRTALHQGTAVQRGDDVVCTWPISLPPAPTQQQNGGEPRVWSIDLGR